MRHINHHFLSFLLVGWMTTTGLQAQGYRDVTSSYIKNANQAASTGWTYTRQTTGGETKTWSAINKLYSGSYDSEIYAGDQLNYTTFSAYQTITLPKGIYHLVGKAFQRDVPNVVLYAEIDGKKNMTKVVSVYGQFSTTSADKSPNSMETAAKAFNGNMYLNDLEFTVPDDNTAVTIGYSGEFTAAKQWFIFGAMNLYQVQDEVSTTYPVDVTPSLNRSRESFMGLTGPYTNANIYIHEKYANSNFPAGELVSKTFSGLQNGIYEVVINSTVSKANGVGSLPTTNPYVYAGSIRATVVAKEQSSVTTVGEYKLSRVPVTDGTLNVGLYNQMEGANWALFNVKSVKYCGVDLSILVESYKSLLESAKDLQDDIMQASVKVALNDAIAFAETDVNTDSQTWLESAISSLSTVIGNAQASNTLYVGAILNAVNGMKAQSANESVKTALQEKYDNGEYTSVADVYATYQPLEIAALGTEPKTDYTSVIINPSFELGNTDGWSWDITGTDTGVHHTNNDTYRYSGTDGEYLFNTWSTAIRTLDLHQTITGLPLGYYTLSTVVATFGDGSPVTLLANNASNSVKVTSDDVDGAKMNGHVLTVEDIFVSDGTLSIRLQNTGRGETLMKCDDFHLSFSAPYVPLDNYADLSFSFSIENTSVADYLRENTYTESTASVLSNYDTDVALRNDRPASISLPIPLQSTDATLFVSLSSDYTDATTFTVPAHRVAYDLINLLPQQTYYYKVEANGTVITDGTISTTGSLRMICGEGFANARDLGGWTTTDGGTIRYGKLFRGTELRGGSSYIATDADLMMLKKQLGIGAEVDLREDIDFANGTLNASAIDGANYYYANLSRWSENAMREDTKKFKVAFDLLLSTLRNDRAVYFHCIYGADRTGCFAFLLEGLLGMPLDQLYKDYELTSFSSAGLRDKTGIDSKLNYINSIPGISLQERFFNYWRYAVGVSKSDLLDFILIMVDGGSNSIASITDLTVTPTIADGNYYLHLPAAGDGLFIGRGQNYGTRAVPDNYGLPVAVATNNLGITTLRFLDNQLYFGSDAYTDKDVNYSSIAWKVEAQDDHYLLKSVNSYYLQLLTDDSGQRFHVDATSPADATHIAFLSPAEQKAIVAATHEANILSAASAAGITASTLAEFSEILSTHFVATPSAVTIPSASAGSTTYWVLSEPNAHNDSENAYNVGNYGGELYQKNATVSQTVTVPHAGLYKLTLNALYRASSNEICYALGQQGFDNLGNAYVSINDIYFAQIPSWYSDCAGTAYPNNTDEAKALIDKGKYAVELYAYIGEEKKATISINVPGYIPRGWCLFNHFSLTDYAELVTISEDDTEAAAPSDYAQVTLQRSFQPEIWNSFSVPFNLSTVQIRRSPLAGASIYAYESSTDHSINFSVAYHIEACKPYLLKLSEKTTEAIENPSFMGVTILPTEGITEGNEDVVQFVAQLYNSPFSSNANAIPCYLSTDGSIMRFSSSDDIKGLNAYFLVPDAASEQAVEITFTGKANAITQTNNDSSTGSTTIYNLVGQRLQSPRRGIKIVGGKKLLVK